jgi:predicted transcriptional regulator
MYNLNFACKTFSMDEILKCSFNITSTELKILKIILKEDKEYYVKDISKKLNKDRSTIQRALNNLIKENLIKKQQKNITTGGYIYIYKQTPKQIIKKRMSNNLENFKTIVLSQIDKW